MEKYKREYRITVHTPRANELCMALGWGLDLGDFPVEPPDNGELPYDIKPGFWSSSLLVSDTESCEGKVPLIVLEDSFTCKKNKIQEEEGLREN